MQGRRGYVEMTEESILTIKIKIQFFAYMYYSESFDVRLSFSVISEKVSKLGESHGVVVHYHVRPKTCIFGELEYSSLHSGGVKERPGSVPRLDCNKGL